MAETNREGTNILLNKFLINQVVYFLHPNDSELFTTVSESVKKKRQKGKKQEEEMITRYVELHGTNLDDILSNIHFIKGSIYSVNTGSDGKPSYTIYTIDDISIASCSSKAYYSVPEDRIGANEEDAVECIGAIMLKHVTRRKDEYKLKAEAEAVRADEAANAAIDSASSVTDGEQSDA